MNCDEAQRWAACPADARRSEEHRAALEHISTCGDCREARRAVTALAAERRRSVPAPPAGALERAVNAATAAARARPKRASAPRAGFWLGMGLGGSLAAALALAWIVWAPGTESGAKAMPEIALALNETREVNIAVDAPAPLADAEIHVVLTGAIGLAGFEGQKELRWHTDLAAGANQLTLPIVALGPVGGQLVVEVQHGERHRTFVVDVKADGRRPAA
jgi:hypothetical protein